MRCSFVGLVQLVSPLRTAPQGGMYFKANYTEAQVLTTCDPLPFAVHTHRISWCWLSAVPYSSYGCGFALKVFAYSRCCRLITLMHWPFCGCPWPWPWFTPHSSHRSSQLPPHHPRPLCTDLSRFQRTQTRCADLMMQILGGGEQLCTPRKKKNVGNSPKKRLTDWNTAT
jgi:hypothetical protein